MRRLQLDYAMDWKGRKDWVMRMILDNVHPTKGSICGSFRDAVGQEVPRSELATPDRSQKTMNKRATLFRNVIYRRSPRSQCNEHSRQLGIFVIASF